MCCNVFLLIRYCTFDTEYLNSAHQLSYIQTGSRSESSSLSEWLQSTLSPLASPGVLAST